MRVGRVLSDLPNASMAWKRFFRRAAWDDERARELDAHLVIETDENVARGGKAAIGAQPNAPTHAILHEHLLSLGHRTVHHVAGPSGWRSAGLRADGWRDTLVRAGAPVPEIQHGDWSAPSGPCASGGCPTSARASRDISRRDIPRTPARSA